VLKRTDLLNGHARIRHAVMGRAGWGIEWWAREGSSYNQHNKPSTLHDMAVLDNSDTWAWAQWDN
jgi:hypothetical protein